MAIYHCSIKNIGRSNGRSAVACSAYRAAQKLRDKETGLLYDFTKKTEVIYSEIFLCKNVNIQKRKHKKVFLNKKIKAVLCGCIK